MYHQKRLHGAIKLALAVGIAGISVPVFAQPGGQPSPQGQSSTTTSSTKKKPEQLQTVVVTGTRLPSVTITASSPVTTVSAQAFKVTGVTSVDDLVNQMPQMTPYFDQFQNNGATGYPTADLRGLGTDRTLVLINGERVQAGSNFAVDLSQIPTELVKRVDILTGGASAVYGADAVAGVVNFVLDDNFTGLEFSYNVSGYQHDNRNKYMQGLNRAAGFSVPNGNTGLDGITRRADVIMGGMFADGKGHAMGWISAQKAKGVLQGTRDYSNCALNSAGTACGGSSTAPYPNFFVFNSNFTQGGFAHIDRTTGNWASGTGMVYNYAPLNWYMRPDTRINAGLSIKYDVNDYFRPYMDFMFMHRQNNFQLAQTGTFYEQTLSIDCTNPAMVALTGTLCGTIDNAYPGITSGGPLVVYVGKRDVEGGPRTVNDNTDSYRTVIGAKGDLNINWSYNVAAVLGQTVDESVGQGDFLSNRVAAELYGCPAGSFSGCVPYDVWSGGLVSKASVIPLLGTSMTQTKTRLMDINAYISGDFNYSLPWADNDPISLVAGTEWRKENFDYIADSNSQQGNFTGSGGPSLPLHGQIQAKELYGEAGIPLVENKGVLTSLALNLGYRYSDYKISGKTNTYKFGFNSEFAGKFRIRGGYNRAVRAPNVSNLFATQQIALWSGSDPCAGPTPTDTLAQCQNTGVTAAQYGNVPDNPAGQYNQYIGGNLNLKPEKADTYTLGFATTPFEGMEAALDWYDIKIKDTISTIGAATTLDFCAKTGNPFLCDKIHRNPATGDLWLGQTGYVTNLTDNFGNLEAKGIDLHLAYKWQMFGGDARATLVGTRVLNYIVDPLPGVNSAAKYDCAGKVNLSCFSPKWRHIANFNYSRDWWSVNVRWRYMGSVKYINTDGSLGSKDQLVAGHNHNIGAFNWFDVSGTFDLSKKVNLTVGVNNIADRQPPLVGNSLTFNANTPGGYDELGRYLFANVTFKL